jgi:intraflagellar transport protein 88
MDANEDLYSDYDYDIGGFGSAPASNPFQPKTPGGFPASRMGTASRLRTAGGSEVRPMTSTTGSGFSSKPGSSLGRPANFDPLNQGRGPAPPLAKREDNSAEDKAREYEKQVHALVEASADLALKGDADGALEKAKDAGKRERALCKHREANGLVDQINIDLTYAVCFNLAHAYHGARMHDEALHTYSLLVKNKQYPQSGRLRVNMGNIYFEQQKYQTAIKMYRMALDQIPNTGKHIRFKIFRNIGNAFVKLGQFSDAVQSYETIMGGDPDFHTGFNLILCYYALGDAEKMRRGFQKLISIPLEANEDDSDDLDRALGESKEEFKEESKVDKEDANAKDGLRHELLKREKEARNYMLTAARLIAPELKIDGDDSKMAGYQFCIESLKQDHESVSSEMEIERALKYMRVKEFGKAIEALKAFEKRDQHLKAMAATNLSFIYFLEGDIRSADKYADLAYEHDRYNARALVNKGNCLAVRGDYDTAKQFYLEAIGVEADCVEAIYDLGLVNLKMELWAEALQAFEKLHQVVPNNAEVIYQIAALHEAQGQVDVALKWYNILITRVPSDPGVLLRMGQLCNRNDDEAQAFHFHLESYRHYPVSLDVISWLGVWYVKSEMYEKAIHFFERAAQIQPKEVKWRLMVTSCYRRMGNYQRALELYEKVHAEHPENAECLRYLVAICKDLGQPCDHYQAKLSRLDQRAQQTQQSQGQLTRAAPQRDRTPPRPYSPERRASPPQQQHLAAPKARGLADQNPERPRTAAKRPDEDEFDDADVGEMLPGM